MGRIYDFLLSSCPSALFVKKRNVSILLSIRKLVKCNRKLSRRCLLFTKPVHHSPLKID